MSAEGFGASSASSPFDDEHRFGGPDTGNDAPKPTPSHRLESPDMVALHRRLVEWYDQESLRQAANRYQMALDCDYYDGMQWSEEDAQTLLERNQAPLVYNEIKPTIDWIIGTERRTRINYKVYGREKNDSDSAEQKTQLLKYLDDVNRTPFSRSQAFSETVKAGLSWLEVGLCGDPDEELIFKRHESWQNVLYDSNDKTLDLKEARYLFRSRTLDADIAEAYFPDRRDVVRRSAMDGLNLIEDDQDSPWYLGTRVSDPTRDYGSPSQVGRFSPIDLSTFTFSRRSLVKAHECWYRVPVLRRRFGSGKLRGEVFSKSNPEHIQALRNGVSLFERLDMMMRIAIFTKAGLLWEGPSPFKHQRFPFIPLWCYRRMRDNAPYGAIRQQRDPQDDLNKRASKALWILSSNQVEMEEGAVPQENIEQLREEVARPDGIISGKKGYRLDVKRDNALAQEQLLLMDRDARHIRNVGGVTEENLGKTTNAMAGVAIDKRQEQGSVVTAEIFDNLRLAVQIEGELTLALIEQFYTEQKVIRIVGERGAAKFHTINDVDPDTGEILNPITASKADFQVDEVDFKSSLRQAMLDSMFEIVGRLAQVNPEVALKLLDLVVDLADVPNRDAMVARIRKINGERDPDTEMTPEEEAAQKEADAKATEEQDLRIKTLRAELENLVAKAADTRASALKKGVEADYNAMQAAQVVATVPQVAPIADELLKGAGYQPIPGGVDPNVPQPAAPIAQPMDMPETAGVGEMAGIETPRADGIRMPGALNQP